MHQKVYQMSRRATKQQVMSYRWGTLSCVMSLMGLFLLLGCQPTGTSDQRAYLNIYGPLRGFVVDDAGRKGGYATDSPTLVENPGQRRSSVSREVAATPHYTISAGTSGSYTGTFHVVAAGPSAIEVLTDTGSSESAMTAARALFLIDAPVGATVTLRGRVGQTPQDLRVQIDRDADGSVDAEQAPDGWQDEGTVRMGGSEPRAEVTVDEQPDGHARVSLTARSDGSYQGQDVRLFYTVFPNHLGFQRYTEPFMLSEPSLVFVGAFDATGKLGLVREVEVLGGLGADLAQRIETDGSSTTVSIDQPGQIAELTFAGKAGQRLQLLLSDNSIGFLPDAGFTVDLDKEDGRWSRSEHVVGRDGMAIFAELPLDGTYRIRIDPQVANTGNTTLRLIDIDTGPPILSVGSPAPRIGVTQPGRPGQPGIASFDGIAGERVQLVAANLIGQQDHFPSNLAISVTSPSGLNLLHQGIERAGGQFELTLPQTGRYIVRIHASADTTGSVELSMQALPDPSPVS